MTDPQVPRIPPPNANVPALGCNEGPQSHTVLGVGWVGKVPGEQGHYRVWTHREVLAGSREDKLEPQVAWVVKWQTQCPLVTSSLAALLGWLGKRRRGQGTRTGGQGLGLGTRSTPPARVRGRGQGGGVWSGEVGGGARGAPR
jgi:hypothetical protein